MLSDDAAFMKKKKKKTYFEENDDRDDDDDDDEDDDDDCFASLGNLDEDVFNDGSFQKILQPLKSVLASKEDQHDNDGDRSFLEFMATNGFGNAVTSSESNDEFPEGRSTFARAYAVNDFANVFGDYEHTHSDVLEAFANERSNSIQLILTQKHNNDVDGIRNDNNNVMQPIQENIVAIKRRPGRPRKVRTTEEEVVDEKATAAEAGNWTAKKRKNAFEDNSLNRVIKMSTPLFIPMNGGKINSNATTTTTTTTTIPMNKKTEDDKKQASSREQTNKSSREDDKKQVSSREHTKKSSRSTSKYRGVTHHCRTGRWEAHIWEDGKQVYLGGFDGEEQAALAYDIAACKCRGETAVTNFAKENYARELANLSKVDKNDLVLSLRRQSKGGQPKKSSSKYRGVTKHQKGKWEARIGNLIGKKYRYLGLHQSEDEAAMAYDIEAVRLRGFDAVTNFDISEYADVLTEHHASKMRDAVALKIKSSAAEGGLKIPLSISPLKGSLSPDLRTENRTILTRSTNVATINSSNNAPAVPKSNNAKISTRKQETVAMALQRSNASHNVFRIQHVLGPATTNEPSLSSLNTVKAFFDTKPIEEPEGAEGDNTKCINNLVENFLGNGQSIDM
jgi:hypothetical protein